MKKILYISDNQIYKSDLIGIRKKIKNQLKFFESRGFEVHSFLRAGETKVKFNKKDYQISSNKFKNHLNFFNILNKILLNKKLQFEFVYIRNTVNINLIAQLKFFKIISKSKLILEIPTFPYKYHYNGALKRTIYIIDRLKYLFIRNNINVILYSGEQVNNIFGHHNIRKINHYVNLDKFNLKKNLSVISEPTFISVSSLNEYHGISRIIEGVKSYKSAFKKVDFKVLIVGYNELSYEKYNNLINKYNLEEYVKMLGLKSGNELDYLFNISNIAISTLALYKIKLNSISSMKSAEYAARGIPFIVGYTDTELSDYNFTYEVPNDSSPINFKEVLDWYKKITYAHPRQIREVILNKPNWEKSIENIINEI